MQLALGAEYFLPVALVIEVIAIGWQYLPFAANAA